MVPVVPESAPFSAEQRAWLNGFFAGLFSRGEVDPSINAPDAQRAAAAPPLTPLTILFGSQTGTAEGLAKRAAKEAGKRGFTATVLDMAQTEVARLGTEKNLLVITSTYGDGEPPDNAKALHAQLSGATARLPGLRYAVCALGDRNYAHFCRCGRDFDVFFEKAGAARVTARADCDVDYDTMFATWLDTALGALRSEAVGTADARTPGASAKADPATTSAFPDVQVANRFAPAETAAPAYSRAAPFPALVLASRNLNAPESAKRVHQVEFDLGGSGLSYQAGDALGVVPQNCPELVDEILDALECDGEEAVPAPDTSSVPLRRALTELYDLGRPTDELLQLVGGHPQPIATGTAAMTDFAPSASQPHHVIDLLLARRDATPAPIDFVRALRKLQPRLYSISSSPHAHAPHVHLTVGALRYDASGRPRKGVCSNFLADRVVPGMSRVGVFVHGNDAFRPPAGGDTPIVMIGPGTGIAPFRAFLHERRATGAPGRNWLFFGDQRAATDFLYADEMLAFRTDGLLTRLDLAWSRDQADKVYVQHRMLEHAAELYAWLEAGAHVYVCGDASRMAKDVDAALHAVVERAGGKTSAQSAEYVQSLRAGKRYCRDVY